ncbi:MAG: BsuPI-related putative proteinase inhibitor, partial [Candidatus Latescibacterota bacterium]
MKNVPITIILSLVMLFAAAGIGHALMVEMSLEDLTRGASHIVIGTVTDMEVDSVGTADDQSMIYTFVRMRIEQRLKGVLEAESAVVRVLGGKIGELEIRVEDQPAFEQGQRVFLFLVRKENHDFFEVYGLFQGVLEPTEEIINHVSALLDGTTPLEAADYFPMKANMYWDFETTGSFGGKITDRIEAATDAGYRFASYNGQPRTFTKSGSQISEIRVREDGTIDRRRWYDFSAEIGDTWIIERFDHTEGDLMDGTIVTVAGKNEEIRTPDGLEYAKCIHLEFEPGAGIADAGLLGEWFAPGKGCVKRVVQSIAGPIAYQLTSTGIKTPTDPQLSTEITTDKEQYEEGENISIALTVTNNGEEAFRLDFPTSLQADYVIDGYFKSRAGHLQGQNYSVTDGIYRWSADKAFAQVLTTVTIPAGERHIWDFVHTPEDAPLSTGPHTIIGLLTSNGSFLHAQTQILVGHVGRIEGTVKDEGGLPIPEVRIVAYQKGNPLAMGGIGTDPNKSDAALSPVPMLEPVFATTDEQGGFVFESLLVGESYLIGAFREGYDLVWTEIEVLSESQALDLVLPETVLVNVTGRILDQNESPVVEAILEGIAYPDFGWLDLFENLPLADAGMRTLGDEIQTVESLFGSMEPWRSDLENWLPLSRSYRAFTGAEGHFVLEGVPVGWHLIIHAARTGYEKIFAEIEVTSEPDPVHLTMTQFRLGQIRGIVSDAASETPIPGAHIVAYPIGDQIEPVFDGPGVLGEPALEGGASDPNTTGPDIISYPALWGPYYAETDENGEFTLNEVNLDMRFVLWVYKEGYNPAQAEIESSSESPYVRIAMEKIETAVLTGIVTD